MKPRVLSAIFFAIILALALAPLAALADDATPTQPESPGPTCTLHKIVRGETLSDIAALYGVAVVDLVALNNLSDAYHIYAGQTLTIGCSQTDQPTGETDQTTQDAGSTPLTSPISLSDAPRVTGAISTGCRQVKVFFSETMNDAAEDPANYSIVQANGDAINNRLIITQARFADAAHAVVELTTLAQDEVRYQLTAVAMRDLDNQPLAPRGAVLGVVVDPSAAPFQGTPPGAGDLLDAANSTLLDADGDTLIATVEQRGWEVNVTLTGGKVVSRRVTSDPASADTDKDGIDDADEQAYGTDPRTPDTDGDRLTDYQELVEVFSDPAAQDSDADSMMDGLEIDFFKTSPLLADTDGDQFTDDRELFSLDRNPLVADLPRMQIFVGDTRLSLNVISAYTDENGEVKETQEALQTTIGESKELAYNTSSTVSNETSLEFGQKVGVGFGYDKEKGYNWKVNLEASFGQKIANGFSATTDQQTAETATKEYQNSISRGLTQSKNRAVTRTAETAEIVTHISIQNQSDIAFSIRNIELSVLQQDRRKADRFVPIAALRWEGADASGEQPSFNLGPFDPQRGPLIFKNTTIFPSLVEQYLREPQGLIYKVVNFDLVDEFGRNFVFSNQEVNDHTAGITIDYGDGAPETYRVATNNLYDDAGRMKPITMERALEIIGIARSAEPSADTAAAVVAGPAVERSYGTTRNASGVEELTRMRDTQADLASPTPENRAWMVYVNGDKLSAQDFSTIGLRARDDVLLVFTRDQDGDGLNERQETHYGSSDNAVDSDGDGLDDYSEVKEGWRTTVKGADERVVFSSPAMPDSDLDLVNDFVEKQYGADPTLADTDLDGLNDWFELNGESAGETAINIQPYMGPAAIVAGADARSNTTRTGDDEEILYLDVMNSQTVVIQAGPNDVIDSTPGGDDFVRAAHDQFYVTDPLNPDTDRDGVTDGREVVLGIDPNRRDAGSVVDSDDDGLTDDEEDAGWKTATGMQVRSSKISVDTDSDGLPDVYEWAIGSNPASPDTDQDGLLDLHEFDPANPTGLHNVQILADAKNRCAHASACAGAYTKPDAQTIYDTNPAKADTDGDGLSDPVELTTSWEVKVYLKDRKEVTSDPRVADKDQDGLTDQAERLYGTDPENSDTDRDGRSDGDEPATYTATWSDTHLSPLRPDYWLTVTLTDVRVDDDCDDDTCQGLELVGDFWLRTPNGVETVLYSQKREGEMCACEVQNCCSVRTCPGASFSWNKSHRFILREGETFRLGTSELGDNDQVVGVVGALQTIGSFNREFPFSLTLQDTFAQTVGAGACKITINYTFTKEK